MSYLGVVYRKELRDAARDRRAMLSALLLMPLGMPFLFGGMIFLAMQDQMEEIFTTLSVPIVRTQAPADATPSLETNELLPEPSRSMPTNEVPQLTAELKANGIEPDFDTYPSRASLRAAVEAGEIEVGLVIAHDFGAALQSGAPARVWLLFDASRQTSMVPTRRLRDAIEGYGRGIGTGRLLLRGVDPTIMAPIAILDEDLSTPQSRAILVLGMVTYWLIFATIFGGSQVAMDATVGERERGSLEPLLAMPVWRGTLVAGKILAAATFMVLALAVGVATFVVASRWLPLAELGMAVGLGPAAAVGMWLVLAPFGPLAAGAVTFVSCFAKTLKEAWTYISIAVLVPTLPIIYLMVKPIQASWPLMLVPSLSQHLLVTSLVKGDDVVLGHAITSAASTLAFGALLAWAATTRYRRGRLLA